jgi:hypothetical protein
MEKSTFRKNIRKYFTLIDTRKKLLSKKMELERKRPEINTSAHKNSKYHI